MLLTLLAAADGTRLSKTFLQTDQGVEVFPYPQVRDFYSFTRQPKDLEEILATLQVHAEEGHCLLKGNLDHPLEAESRAGRTNPLEPTGYLLLDLDFDTGFDSLDHFMNEIGLGDVSYIYHHSSSSGIRAKTGLRAHVLVLLDRPQSPALLKEWLKHLNLTVPGLIQNFQLSATKMSLLWPLDITTCQNDKLIYIADPTVDGLEDPMAGQRFGLVMKDKPHAALDLRGVDPAQNQDAVAEAVNTLRAQLGLPKANPRLRHSNGVDVLLNPAACIVTGERRARGFVYLDLNGWGSYAYFYPESNPEILYNFKSEPAVRLADVAPDYYATVKPPPQLDVHNEGTERFVLRDNTSDTYYTAILDPSTKHVELNQAQRKHLPDFLAVAGLPMPENVPEWDLEFNPTTLETFDPERHWINLYRPPTYLTDPAPTEPAVPPTIGRILNSVCASEEVKNHFLNWLAFIFQTRQKPKTAFLFHGIEGTGKGLLYKEVLRPLFGPEYCMLTTVSAIRDGFNDWAGRKIFLCLDEFKVTEEDHQVLEKLRNYITEDFVDIRAMRRNRQLMRNYLALLIFTNHPDAMRIPASDRRYTVAPRQTTKLEITQEEIDQIPDELDSFAAFLREHKVDQHAVRTPLETQAKEQMRLAAEGTGDRIMRAFATGDLQFFVDLLDPVQPVLPDPTAVRYDNLVRDWAETSGPTPVDLSDIRLVHQHLTGGRITKIGIGRLAGTHLAWPKHDQQYTIHFQPLTSPPAPRKTLEEATEGKVTHMRRAR